jgi:hypothetical protein
LEPLCEGIISDVSDYADGVWLWVFLVTRDILREVNNNEGIGTLRKILEHFPADLEEYFKLIIAKIVDLHQEEMAQTFLVTVYELQPLPLYAFGLLEEEKKNPDYSLIAPIKQVSTAELELHYPIWRSRVQNRCGDLLVVD